MKSSFSKRLEYALDRLHVGPTDLAKRIGVRKQTVSNWLNRGSTPRDNQVIQAIASALGIDYVWLATGKGEMINREKELRSKDVQIDAPRSVYILVGGKPVIELVVGEVRMIGDLEVEGQIAFDEPETVVSSSETEDPYEAFRRGLGHDMLRDPESERESERPDKKVLND